MADELRFVANDVSGGMVPVSGHHKGENRMSSLEEQVHEKAHLAVDQLQERAGGRLDYSEASLEAIEHILDLRRLRVGPHVLDECVGLHHIASNLIPPASLHLRL